MDIANRVAWLEAALEIVVLIVSLLVIVVELYFFYLNLCLLGQGGYSWSS